MIRSSQRRVRVPVAIATVVLLVFMLDGCDRGRVGGRCHGGVARDARYVLVCRNGRWARSITLRAAGSLLARLANANGAGAPAGAGLAVPASSLRVWNGPSDINPTTVPGGVVSGFLFTRPVTVSGNVTVANSLFRFDASNHIVVTGTASPGPTFSHIEVDGVNTTTHNDDIGVTNSRHDGGSGGSFTLDRSHLYQLNNGVRLDSNARITNTLIDRLSVAGGSHTDGAEIYCGDHILIDHTTIDAGAANSNAAVETQGGSGGFCPVSHVLFSHSVFAGGTTTWRLDDDQISHVAMVHVRIVAGSYRFLATAVTASTSVDTWEDVALTNGAVIPRPTAGASDYGCGVGVSCN